MEWILPKNRDKTAMARRAFRRYIFMAARTILCMLLIEKERRDL
ncbi:MAG: hypothetical protein AAGE61_09625 [Pseudomonadota bacterium]